MKANNTETADAAVTGKWATPRRKDNTRRATIAAEGFNPSERRGEVVSASKARDSFADLVSRVAYGGERITIKRNGKPVAALVPIADMELLELIEDQIDIEGALQSQAEPGENISLKDIRSKLGL